MAYDRFLIAPINTGLQTDLRPWQIMDDAFEYLQNAYVFRGRLRKRFGSLLMGNPPSVINSRLRINLEGGAGVGITDGAGNATGIIPGILPGHVGQMFSIGTELYTIFNPAAGANPMLDTGATVTKTFNLATGAYNFVGAPANTQIFFYPAFPVMGIDQYEIGAVNNHPTFAFDTQFAYRFTGPGWTRSGTGVTPIWHGGIQDFFWAANWQGLAGTQVLFVTNFQVTNPNGAGAATDDPIWWTANGTTWTAGGSTANGFFFAPNGGLIHTGPYVQTARIIVGFKNRLVLLNTIENDNSGGLGVNTNYVNRARYSFNGSPFARNAWYEPNQTDSSGGVVNNNNIAAGAGFIDASTEEQIISAEFIKDRLIVYFERSTWELAYTGNEILPFIWQKLNTELGSQSTFSTVPFDKLVLTIGNTGVHGCNGSNVERIDQKIPEEIFEFQTALNQTTQTVGIRDYTTELVYWTFVSDLDTPTQNYPNQILVYNYKNGSWALFDDCFTFFGFFEQQTDTTWASSAPFTWEEYNMDWINGVTQANSRQILGGTPEGFMLRLAPGITGGPESRNAPSMQITNITYAATGIITLTIINHNLTLTGAAFGFVDYILLENIVGDATTMAVLNGAIVPVNSIIDANTITVNTNPLTGGPLTSGTYNGGGTMARVSNIQILSKQYNPYIDKGMNVSVAKIDFGIEKTLSGEITVDYYPSATHVSMIQGGQASGTIMGTNVLEMFPYDPKFYPLEQFQQRLWHSIYLQTSGECIQLAMYLKPQQMMVNTIALSDFSLEGMVLNTQPTGRLQ